MSFFSPLRRERADREWSADTKGIIASDSEGAYKTMVWQRGLALSLNAHAWEYRVREGGQLYLHCAGKTVLVQCANSEGETN